ncbi:nuclear transport factor 2 family protein [Sporichthya sp.]|uniref:nuclear transport factor 2 family protein n=1 Tax=Sporichthya sp. TaxID=65475 RepID=UPI0017DED009|nr:nuclear transport factor 2 family protein [Sporichthya sp.]MBA3743235.1 nuclear transport factor 2 family protein [Sporichthya sp.]
MSDENAKVVHEFLAAFAAGDIQTALSCLSEDAVVEEAHGLPFSGDYIGGPGFLDILNRMSSRLGATLDSIDVYDGGDVVVGRLELTFTSLATGRSLKTKAVELYTVADGKITYADVYYKDPGAVSALATES